MSCGCLIFKQQSRNDTDRAFESRVGRLHLQFFVTRQLRRMDGVRLEGIFNLEETIL
jgi:hypothetical protein